MTLRSAWSGASVAVRLLVGVIVLLLILAAVWWAVGAWNDWQKGRTAEKLQKNESTVAEGQRDLGEQLTTREVDTVRHESTITIRTQQGGARVEAVPVGSQLNPLLDELCGLYDYPSDPGCAGRMRDTQDGAGEVQGGPASEE